MQRPPFIQTIHHLYLNSADRKGRDTGNAKLEQRSPELDWIMHMSCMHFHSLPSAWVVSVGPVCDPQNLGLTGMIRKGKACCVNSADTVCVREYHVYIQKRNQSNKSNLSYNILVTFIGKFNCRRYETKIWLLSNLSKDKKTTRHY